jgi:hypothetical protein
LFRAIVIIATWSFVSVGMVGQPAVAFAEPGGSSGISNDPDADARFFKLLEGYPDIEGNMTIWNHQLVKSQGLWACAMESNGMEDWDAIHAIEAQGYNQQDAEAIEIAAAVVYCPQNK